jgi:hypothetical protein
MSSAAAFAARVEVETAAVLNRAARACPAIMSAAPAAAATAAAAAAAAAAAGKSSLAPVPVPSVGAVATREPGKWYLLDGISIDLPLIQPAKFHCYAGVILTALLPDKMVDVRIMSLVHTGIGWAGQLNLADIGGGGMTYGKFVERMSGDAGWYCIAPAVDVSSATLAFAAGGSVVAKRMTDAQLFHSLMASKNRVADEAAQFRAFADAVAANAKKLEMKRNGPIPFTLVYGKGKSLACDTGTAETIGQLKPHVLDKMGAPKGALVYLMMNGKELRDDEEIGEIQHLRGSTLWAVVAAVDQKLEFPPVFEIGKMLMVVDTDGDNCRAIVLDQRVTIGGGGHDVLVRYMDWDAMWTEWIDVASKRFQTAPCEPKPRRLAAVAATKTPTRERPLGP